MLPPHGTIPERVAQWLPEAEAAARLFRLDPLDLLAICDRESNGNPNAQSADGGLGLFQITRRFHPTFCDAVGPDGKSFWRKPAWNTFYAADLLRFNFDLFDGFGVDARLCGVACFNASFKHVREALRGRTRPIDRTTLISILDPLTTPSKPEGPGDYVSDVLRRRESYVLSP